MRQYGFHLSTSPDLSNAPMEANELKVNSLQIFIGNPRGWIQNDPDESSVQLFKEKVLLYKINTVVVHMPYLPNLASPEKEKYKKSVDSLVDQLKKATRIKANYLVLHIGKAMGLPYEKAIARIAKAIQSVFKKVSSNVMLLLENTAGQGTEIGFQFEHIRDILKGIDQNDRMGVCLDTAHLFESGYDLRDEKSVNHTFKMFDKIVGIKFLKVIHYNDSLTEYNSHVDRHFHLGKGQIGNKGLKAVINHKHLKNLPFIMETPVKIREDELKNLRTLKRYIK